MPKEQKVWCDICKAVVSVSDTVHLGNGRYACTKHAGTLSKAREYQEAQSQAGNRGIPQEGLPIVHHREVLLMNLLCDVRSIDPDQEGEPSCGK